MCSQGICPANELALLDLDQLDLTSEANSNRRKELYDINVARKSLFQELISRIDSAAFPDLEGWKCTGFIFSSYQAEFLKLGLLRANTTPLE
jgi:hypothetical protein